VVSYAPGPGMPLFRASSPNLFDFGGLNNEAPESLYDERTYFPFGLMAEMMPYVPGPGIADVDCDKAPFFPLLEKLYEMLLRDLSTVYAPGPGTGLFGFTCPTFTASLDNPKLHEVVSFDGSDRIL